MSRLRRFRYFEQCCSLSKSPRIAVHQHHQNHPFAYQNLKTLFRPYPKMQWRELIFFKFAAKWVKVFSHVTEWSASSRIVLQHHILNYAKIQKTYFIWGPLFDLTMSHTPHFVGITAKRMSYIKLFFFSAFLKLSTMSAKEIGKSDENSFPCTQGVSVGKHIHYSCKQNK